MVVNNKTQELLVDLGLTEYEAKAYMSLMRCQPATPYEIAKAAGLPTSKIYETIKRLQTKGLTSPVSARQGRGQQYMALAAEDFIYRKRQETQRQTEQLGPLLKALSNEADTNFIWQLDEADKVLDKARQLVAQASHSLLLSLWPEELDAIATDLRHAEDRGVQIALVHFGPPPYRIGATFHHPAEDTIHAEKGGRGLTLVADGECVVLATFFATGRVEGAWSSNRAFVYIAEDYVRHDVYITKVAAAFGPLLKERFGDDYAELRDVFKPVEQME